MSSASLRRSITSSDPRSPLQLSSLVTSFPQHQIITSFQTFQATPMRYSPRRTNQSPVYSRGGPRVFSTMPDPAPSSQMGKRRRSSIAKLLTPRTTTAPVMCPCGHGSRSIKHLVKDCPRFEAERERLAERDMEIFSPGGNFRMPSSTVEISAEEPPQRNLVQVVRRRTRTLLGKLDTQKDKGERRSTLTAVI